MCYPFLHNTMFHFRLLQLDFPRIQRDEQDGGEPSQHPGVLDHEEGEIRFSSSYFFSQHVVHLWKLEDTLLKSCRHLVVKPEMLVWGFYGGNERSFRSGQSFGSGLINSSILGRPE